MMDTVARQRRGDVIRARRETLGWSQADLSRESGVPLSTVQTLESDVYRRPQRKTLVKIADALDLDVEALMATSPLSNDEGVERVMRKVDPEIRLMGGMVMGWLHALPDEQRQIELDFLTKHIFG